MVLRMRSSVLLEGEFFGLYLCCQNQNSEVIWFDIINMTVVYDTYHKDIVWECLNTELIILYS